MEYIKLMKSLYGSYSYCKASNVEMNILGDFLSSDYGCDTKFKSLFRQWALDDSLGYSTSGNTTYLDKENNYIYLSDLFSRKNPIELKMTREQFVQILDDWKEKVCKQKPKEVIIKYENYQFTIETKN